MHQERHYPGRVVATALRNPDFAALARACGAVGELVERTEQFMPALERALAADRSTLLELRTAPEAISPSETIASIRAARSGGAAIG
jgi:acetolactate synthase-1/2/3 large subunit